MSKQSEHLQRLNHNKIIEKNRRYDKIINSSKEILKNEPTLSVQNIADRLDISYSVTYSALKKSTDLNISTNNNGKRSFGSNNNGHDKRQSIPDSDVNDIIQMYIDNLMTMKQIGKKYNCTAGAVLNFFKKHGIARRSISEANKLTWTEEKKQLARARGQRKYLTQRKEDTLPEKKFYNWAIANNINIIKQYIITGSYHPYDFYLPSENLLVEIDGTFWHSLPKQQVKDEEQVAFAINSGYNIIRIDATHAHRADYDFSLWLKEGGKYV